MVENIEYLEEENDKIVYTGESITSAYDNPVEWSKMRNIIAFTDWIFDGSAASPQTEQVIEICDKLVNEYGLTVSVDVTGSDKDLTLRGLYIEEDIEVGSEYAEVRQFLVNRFEKRFGYSIDLSGEIKQAAT